MFSSPTKKHIYGLDSLRVKCPICQAASALYMPTKWKGPHPWNCPKIWDCSDNTLLALIEAEFGGNLGMLINDDEEELEDDGDGDSVSFRFCKNGHLTGSFITRP